MYSLANHSFPNRPRWQQVGLLALTLAYVVAFVILPSGFDIPYYYLPALAGAKPMLYPYWAYWLFAPLTIVPFKINYFLLIVGLLIGIIIACQSTGGSPWLLLLSFPFVWVLWYGQAESLVAMGIALMWHGRNKQDARWIGIGLLLASLKPHITGPAAAIILWQLKNWPLRLKSLWLLGPVILLSLVRWGWLWPVDWLANISSPVFRNSYNNGSLWVWFGPWALILWVPALFVPMNNRARVLLALATSLLTMPYVPPYSQLALYLFPMPIWIWIWGYLPWMQLVFGDGIFRFNFLVPALTALTIYISRRL